MRFLKIILFLLLTSCVKTISLNDLDSSVVKYEDLPLYVRETVFKNPEVYMKESFINLDRSQDYMFYTKKTFMPWIKKLYIINTHKNINYSISNYSAIPLVIYKDNLYIPLKSLRIDIYQYGYSDFKVYNLK